jgi:hypothetical protein
MNAKLLIIAILTAVILALYMTVSAPAPEGEPDIRVTLGGDCSADRATGDLYHPVDPYCIVAEGPTGGSMAPNGPGAGYDARQADDTSNREADEPGRKHENGSSSTPAIVPVTGNGPDDPAILVNPPAVEPEDPTTPEIDVLPPTGPHDGPKDPDKNQPKDPNKDDDSRDKQCKKDGRDNVNSQGNHDCSGDQPDPHSGQERTTDHGQGNGSNDQVVNQGKHKDDDQKSPEKECKKADRDNVNSQGNHDCSADHPDTNSDQQLTTDHGPADQAPANDQGNKKGKKD